MAFKKASVTQINNDFFTSLDNLSALYKLDKNFRNDMIFPLNISTSFGQVKEEMEKQHPDLELWITKTGRSAATIATYKQLSIGYTLYYVPLEPLLKMHRAKNKESFQLALSVCSYLHHVVGIPLLNGNDYIAGCYEMVEEWVSREPDEWDDRRVIKITCLTSKK